LKIRAKAEIESDVKLVKIRKYQYSLYLARFHSQAELFSSAYMEWEYLFDPRARQLVKNKFRNVKLQLLISISLQAFSVTKVLVR
jgi:hypothetical protein